MKSLLFVMGIAAFAAAATAAGPVAFEVASIKPADPSFHGKTISRQPGGRFSTKNVSLKMLITFAYDVRDFQVIGGPGWVDSDSWDITAKSEKPEPADGEMREMVRTLLAERFQLAFHMESKEAPIYVLVAGKGGPKLETPKPGDQGPQLRMGRGVISGVKIPMALFAKSLSSLTGRTVVDKTELAGDYNFKVEFTPDLSTPMATAKEGIEPTPPAADTAGPSIFTALQEQLGLRLEGQKGPVDVLVIDRAEKASEN